MAFDNAWEFRSQKIKSWSNDDGFLLRYSTLDVPSYEPSGLPLAFLYDDGGICDEFATFFSYGDSTDRGCEAFITKPREKLIRSAKMAPRAWKGNLVGLEGLYGKIYQVWLPDQQIILRARDIRFKEATSLDPPPQIDYEAQLAIEEAEEIPFLPISSKTASSLRSSGSGQPRSDNSMAAGTADGDDDQERETGQQADQDGTNVPTGRDQRYHTPAEDRAVLPTPDNTPAGPVGLTLDCLFEEELPAPDRSDRGAALPDRGQRATSISSASVDGRVRRTQAELYGHDKPTGTINKKGAYGHDKPTGTITRKEPTGTISLRLVRGCIAMSLRLRGGVVRWAMATLFTLSHMSGLGHRI
ncbi:hypothetical protein XA68_15188 [Ophiocordyceps unilateralis]|uniref:Retroviral polymerase SH3-like domain-containing protein n=1 Tax=Ophiocordyceps unilateralis TaxID=268505 RepID=A0A2A9PMG5_OPHUN|nr:hypothetical protein XA68_15188 [Ophiocordyceps unilateralis]